MKTHIIIFFALMIITTGTGFAQDIPQSEVPEAVIRSFNEKFPKASDVEWERKGELYEVDFDMGFFADHDAWFDASGKMTRHKEEIAKSDLPKAVTAAITSQFSEYRIDDVDKITENGKVSYKVELENGDSDRKVYFSEDGTFIR